MGGIFVFDTDELDSEDSDALYTYAELASFSGDLKYPHDEERVSYNKEEVQDT